MNNGFTKGLIIGGLIGLSVSMMAANQDMMNDRNKKRMLKRGRHFFRRSGSMIGGVVDMLR